MNERIKELLPKPWTFPYPDREMYTKEQLAHLAELIVKECIVVVQNGGGMCGAISSTNLKQHFFGVEE